jgi:hypothetical protein
MHLIRRPLPGQNIRPLFEKVSVMTDLLSRRLRGIQRFLVTEIISLIPLRKDHGWKFSKVPTSVSL